MYHFFDMSFEDPLISNMINSFLENNNKNSNVMFSIPLWIIIPLQIAMVVFWIPHYVIM